MMELPDRAPDIHQHFMNGNFVVARTAQSFAQVPVDQALEQTLNRDSKTSGGIVGFSNRAESVHRWMNTAYYQADLLCHLKSILGMTSDQDSNPKGLTQSTLARDNDSVYCLSYTEAN